MTAPAPHGESHAAVLPPFVPEGMRAIDGVVVPNGRMATHLHPAARLAADLGCPLPYDPFRNPRRGALEEFGETIAEGLVGYLEQGGAAVPDLGYWADFLPRRAR